MASTKLLWLLGGAVLGLGVGYLLFRADGSAVATSASIRPAPPAVQSANESAPSKPGPLSHDTIATSTQRVLALNDPLEKMGAWVELISKADVATLNEIRKVYMDYYRSGGLLPDEFLDKLGFREGQLLGASCIELPKEPSGQIMNTQMRQILGFASTDPAGAAAWAEALPEGGVKDAVLLNCFQGSSGSHPEAAMEMFEKLPLHLRPSANFYLAEALFRTKGMTGSLDWFQSNLPDQTDYAGRDAHTKLFSTLCRRLGQTTNQPSEQIMDVLKRPELAPFLTNEAVSNATRNISVSNPGLMFDFLSQSLPQQGTTVGATLSVASLIGETINHASKKSINSVGDWLNQHPDHALRQQVLMEFIPRASWDDPETAQIWLNQVQDPTVREKLKAKLEKRSN
jgi:hypothetical protein